MKHLNTFVISLLVVIFAALATSCGGTNIGISQPDNNALAGAQNIDGQINLNELPAFPLDEENAADDSLGQDKGASWLNHPNHLAPDWNVLGGIDPGDPGCYLLQGQKINFGAQSVGYLAAAMYKIPLGATEVDLLDMKVAAQIGAPTDNYFAAIANFTAMHWQFYGPLNSPSWNTDMTSLGYDFTGPGGNMYVVLIALPGQSLHISDITLNFKDGDKPTGKPTWWNVYGQAFEDYITSTPHAAYQVTFEDIHTGVTYTTMTSSAGRWGMNLPTGEYQFYIDSNEMLLDVSGPVAMIDYIYQADGIGIRVDLDNTGHIVYQDVNYAAYAGSVVPMPLITANNF